jgi:cell division septum initiation protein DivIVA
MTSDKDYRGFLNEEEELDFHRWLGMNYKQYKEELKQAKEDERKRILEIIDKQEPHICEESRYYDDFIDRAILKQELSKSEEKRKDEN